MCARVREAEIFIRVHNAVDDVAPRGAADQRSVRAMNGNDLACRINLENLSLMPVGRGNWKSHAVLFMASACRGVLTLPTGRLAALT